MAITEKKEAFARAKVRGLSNKEAAIEAGYEKKTASAAGSRLAKDPDVIEEIARLLALKGDESLPVAAPALDFEPKAAKEGVKTAKTESGERESAESLDRIALSARERAIVRGTNIELDGVVYDQTDPKDQLILCQLGVLSLTRQQIDAARALLPYLHGKVADMGKKDAERERALQAGGGRFGAMSPPNGQRGDKQGVLWQ